MTYGTSQMHWPSGEKFSNTHILMPQMLQKLQLAVGALGKDRCAERLHDLLDSDSLVGKLVLGRTGALLGTILLATMNIAHQTRPKAP